MYRPRALSEIGLDRPLEAMAAPRARVGERLVRTGMARPSAELLIDEWLRSTEMLTDFVAAPDYWHLAYQFAFEEYRRRAHGHTATMRTDRRP
jgi:hypothetical protein